MDDTEYEESQLQIEYIIENYEKILNGVHPFCGICRKKRPKLHWITEINDLVCDKCARNII